MSNSSLVYSKWNCKYYIVLVPKYNKQIVYTELKADIGKILRKLCEHKGVKIIKAVAHKNHVHMLVSIPPSLRVSEFIRFLKARSTFMIFDMKPNLKYKYVNRQFWCKGYYIDTIYRNKKVIEEYIKSKIQEDIAYDQMNLKEYIDPLTCEPVKQRKK